MIPNKRDLKAFVRYDGTGRIVPSSVILARKKPKVGSWTEIDAYECCSPSAYPNIYVCGAGTDEVNGAYTYAGIRNGKPYYIKGVYVISWGEYPNMDDWEIYNSTLPGFDKWLYYSGDWVATPDLATTWWVDEGLESVPHVGLEPCPLSPFFICVAGLVSHSELNGTYTYVEESMGKPHYQKPGDLDIYWDGSKWWISDDIYSSDDVADPTLVTTWVGTGGSITVTEGSCEFPNGCYTVTLTCTEEASTATFYVNYCYEYS